MKKLLAFGIAGLLLSSSAYSVIKLGSGDATQRLNIDIPTDNFTVEQAREVINSLADWIKEGEQEVVFADVLQQIQVPGEFQALVEKIVASRDPSATVLCHERKCKITSTGDALSIKVDGVSIPVFGVPTVSIADEINIYAQVNEDRTKAEICRIEGINVKAGFINAALEGAIIELNGDKIKTLRVDAGSGGDYPTAACDFDPADIVVDEETPAVDQVPANQPATDVEQPSADADVAAN